MHDLGYIISGYGATAAMLVVYRWRLAVRARRSHQLVAALNGHRPAPRKRP
jgi:hypothetical protein